MSEIQPLYNNLLNQDQLYLEKQFDVIEKKLPEVLQSMKKVFLNGFGKQAGLKEKSPGDFVTEQDLQIETMFREWVQIHFPEHAVFGEEQHGIDEGKMPEWLWAIDPIDGTNNYQFGNTDTSIVISLRYKGIPVLALCDLPMKNDGKGDQYYTRLGKGMTKNGQKVSSTTITEMKYVPLVTTKLDRPRRMMSMVGDLWDSVAGVHMNMSSVYEACRVASGEMGIGVFYGNGPHEWPAMYLFAKESGCVVGELENPNKSLDLNGIVNKSLLIAGNESLFNQAKNLIHLPESLPL